MISASGQYSLLIPLSAIKRRVEISSEVHLPLALICFYRMLEPTLEEKVRISLDNEEGEEFEGSAFLAGMSKVSSTTPSRSKPVALIEE